MSVKRKKKQLKTAPLQEQAVPKVKTISLEGRRIFKMPTKLYLIRITGTRKLTDQVVLSKTLSLPKDYALKHSVKSEGSTLVKLAEHWDVVNVEYSKSLQVAASIKPLLDNGSYWPYHS